MNSRHIKRYSRRSLRLLAAGCAALLGIALLGGCSKDKPNDAGGDSSSVNNVGTAYADKVVGFQLEKPAAGETIAILHTSMGDMSIRFFPEAAPKAVQNFLTHAEEGYYNGLTFHRIVKDFMIQGGDPEGTGTGGESIWGEPFEDEFDQKLLNLRGSLAMANSGVNTNGSQFFINQSPASSFPDKETLLQNEESLKESAKEFYKANKSSMTDYKNWEELYEDQGLPQLTPIPSLVPDEVWSLYEKNGGNIHLDGAWRSSGGHTVFGQVFEGMDVLDAIAGVEVDSNSKPLTPVTITSIEVVEYKG